jgi:hypothetical protein
MADTHGQSNGRQEDSHNPQNGQSPRKLPQKSAQNSTAARIGLKIPIIIMVLAATAVPVELRPLGRATLGFSFDPPDFLANIVGFVPIGIVLAELGGLRGIIAAALISIFAESSQFVMQQRDPSAMDVAANVIGAMLGTTLAMHWKIRSPYFTLNRSRALIAAMLAIVLIVCLFATSGNGFNYRGVTSPGILEANWRFDENGGRAALDSSGNDLNGKFHHEPNRTSGVRGGAVKLDGIRDYIDFGHPSALRLVGSMTISAWIKSTSYPADDAAIVSQLSGNEPSEGYQLDTSVDRGLHTIGFKLTNECGELMARYGATPLLLDTWYHVAGVYDAETKTLDVYLNGRLDNGFLLGSVTGTQHSSYGSVYVGRRSDSKGYEFAGLIDEVHVYSFPLTRSEIVLDMLGKTVKGPAQRAGRKSTKGIYAPCAIFSTPEDRGIPIVAATLGLLVATAWIGLLPTARLWLSFVVSFAAGFLIYPAMSHTLPAFNLWLVPLVSLAGGASIVMSLRMTNKKHQFPFG